MGFVQASNLCLQFLHAFVVFGSRRPVSIKLGPEDQNSYAGSHR
jgi:hypothetical protein